MIGTATDAYQPAEGRYQVTRRALAVMHAFRNPLAITTKSTLVLRDLDLLADLASQAWVRVSFTITSLDPELWRLVEPGTPPPASRLGVLAKLAATGVPCGVNLAPVLPGLTDSEAAIEATTTDLSIAGRCSERGLRTRLSMPIGRRASARTPHLHCSTLTAARGAALDSVPNGYCGISGCAMSYPVKVAAQAEAR